jgi:hypothetical protein
MYPVRFRQVILASLPFNLVFHHLTNTGRGSRFAAMLVVTVYAEFSVCFNMRFT